VYRSAAKTNEERAEKLGAAKPSRDQRVLGQFAYLAIRLNCVSREFLGIAASVSSLRLH
jgi:hypothetical protein